MELLEQGQILCIRVICAPRQLTSRLSRSTPSSTSPFLSPQSRVPCSHRSCSMVVFSGGFGHVYPRQCVSTEVLKQGSQMAQVLSFWKDVIMCLFMYIHVTHSIFFFFIFWQMPWHKLFGVIASAMEELATGSSEALCPTYPCRPLRASPGPGLRRGRLQAALVSLATGRGAVTAPRGEFRSLDQCNSA